MAVTQTITAETLAVAYRKVADELESVGQAVQSEEDVDSAVYNFSTREELVALCEYASAEDVNLAYLMVWDCADGAFGFEVSSQAARLFNQTL